MVIAQIVAALLLLLGSAVILHALVSLDAPPRRRAPRRITRFRTLQTADRSEEKPLRRAA